MTQRQSVRRLIADLLGALQAKGYPLGPGKLMQVEELLRQLPRDTAPGALRTLLAPLLASSPEEQQAFYALFDNILAGLSAMENTGGGKEPKGPEPPDILKGSDPETRWRRYLLATLLVLAGIAGGIFDPLTRISWILLAVSGTLATVAGWRLPAKPSARLRYLLAIPLLMAAGYGGKLLITKYVYRPKPDDPVVSNPTSRTERFAVAQGGRIEKVLTIPGDTSRLISAADCNGRLSGTTALGNTYVLESAAGTFTFTASVDAPVGGTDSICVTMAFADGRDTAWFIADILEAERRDTGMLSELPLPFPHHPEEMAVDPTSKARADFYRRYQWPLKALLFLLAAFALVAFLRWDERRRAKFVAEIEQREQPPYVWHIEMEEGVRLDFGEGMAMLLNRLRRREAADIHRLDMKATVKASVRKAGRADFRFREQTRPPEYLLLIDRYDANDHQARLFDALYQELRLAEVPAERFYYQGDPRICFNEAHPHGVGLSELLHQHRDARLLLIGEGQRLLNPSTGQRAKWTNLFNGWRRRALLLSKPTRDWGRREQSLAEVFMLSPASMQGLDLALEQFETLAERSLSDSKLRVTDAVAEPFAFEGSLMSSLRRHFPESLIQWIAACAIYPALHWDLTLYLGRTLGDPDGEPLVTYANLRQLTRLPWFLQGRIPENARLQLLEYLSAQGLETRVRRALDELLRRAPAPAPGSVAWDDYRMNVILNELLLKPDGRQRRVLEAEFERFLAAGKQPDFVAFKQLERQPTRLDLLVPDNWKKYLFRHASSRFGWRYYARLLPVLFILGAGIAFAPVKTKVCGGEEVTYEEQSLCLDSPSDRLRYLEYLTRDAIEAQDHERADSLRLEAGALARASVPVADTVPYYRNTAVWYYNYGVRAYNCSRGGANGCPQLAADSLRSQACFNFRRGEALYVSVMGTAGIEFYSAQRLACPSVSDTSTFTLRGRVLDAVDGKAIAGAQVQARTEDGRYAAQSDAEGRYVLERVRSSVQLVLEATAEGYDRSALNVAATTELPPLRLQRSYAARSAAAWARALAADTPEAVSEYLRLFPDGPEAGQARKWLADRAGARERTDWEAADRANTIEAYTAHKRRYPSGVYTAEADKRLAELKEVVDFNEAVAQNTVAAYRGYLNKYPDGTRAEEARSRLNALQAVAEEAQAWQSARTENTPAAYRRYLETWPQGGHAAEAAQLLEGPSGSGDVIKQIEANMVRVKGGSFTMGCTSEQGSDCYDDEKPAHKVTVSDYSIGRYEVTQAQWRAVMGSDPPELEFKGCDNCPVENVSWEDIQEFLSKLNTRTGKTYRLPTEAEWEYAARGGSSSRGYKYAGSNTIDEVAWYTSNSGSKTRPVGQKKANELGLYDMSGNVWEWCQDWYGEYTANAQTNPKGPSRASYRVYRGGGWYFVARNCRSSFRGNLTPSARGYTLGFRLAL